MTEENTKNKWNDFMNLYEHTKTLRFELKPSKATLEELKIKIQKESSLFNKERFINFIKYLNALFFDLKSIIYGASKEGAPFLRKKIEVRYGWLQTYTKIDFYAFQKSVIPDKDGKLPKKYSITEPKYLEEELNRWFSEWEEIIKNIQSLLDQPEKTQKRKREFAQLIRDLKKRQNFEFIREFIKAFHNTNDPAIDAEVEKLRDFVKELEVELYEWEKEFLPSQSAGLQIAKGSFNYYTLNKTPKLLEKEKTEQEELLKKSLSSDIFQRTKFNYHTKIKEILFDCHRDWIKTIGLSENILTKWTLDEAYKEIKKWKAEQKFGFNVAVNNFLSFSKKRGFDYKDLEEEQEEIRNNFPLFDASDKDFKFFLYLTEQIKNLGKEKNDFLQIQNKSKNHPDVLKIDEKAKELAKKRGYFFNSPNNKDRNGQIIQTENYFELCELFKRIALKRGQILAKIISIENEKRESQSLQYWSFLLEEQDKHFLAMIPRGEDENHKKAKAYIEKTFSQGNGEVKLYHFKSLTFRALWKLCFKEIGNTFFPNVADELKLFGDELKDVNIKGKQHKLKSGFYQDVLKTKTVREKLDIVDFGGMQTVLNKEYNENFAEFESDLEKTCYLKKEFYISEEEKMEFLKKYNALVFEITSYDLRIANEGRPENKNHQNKRHTEIWKDFWTSENKDDKYKIRVNPEVKVFWREADEEMERKIKAGKILPPKVLPSFCNRYAQEHFMLAANITLNATEKKPNLAFKTIKEIKTHLQEFNEDFNKKIKNKFQKNEIYYYGIDRGLKELATLCITRFKEEKYTVNGKEINKPEFAEIEVLELKKENYFKEFKKENGDIVKNSKGESIVASKNISLFLNQEDLFEKKKVSCIDLTMAKLIKGKIILNGDVMTYMKLKEISAKRRLFELFSKGKVLKDSEIKITDKIMRIIDNDGKENEIYWLTEEQRNQNEKEKEKTKKDFEQKYRDYLQTLDEKNKFENIETINKINHLRDAITANMVGIIAYLQKQYPGIIALENMESKEHIEKSFAQSNENISRRMEWALFHRFQTEGLVPPQIKQTVFLRDEFAENQFGIVQFVKIENTSKNCPKCENTHQKTGNHYICKKSVCGFSSKDNQLEFEPLNNSDKVAAFNIAKNAFYKIYF